MPMTISVKSDYDRIALALNDVMERQLPFATVLALNDAATAAAAVIRRDMPEIFDRPVPFTMNSVGKTTANKATMTSSVFIKDKQAQYLLHEEEGGTRTAAENVNKPATALIVPSKIPLNVHGNIPNGLIARLFNAVKKDAGRELTDKQKRRKARVDATRPKRDTGYFYITGKGPHGQGPGGLFKRLPGHKMQRMLSFEASAHYEPRMHFRKRVEIVARQTFRVALIRHLRELKGSAKPV